MLFGEFARLKRVEAGLTQQQCADALGFKHRSAFLKKEDGTREWSLSEMMQFAELLDQKPSELFAEFESRLR